MKKIYAVKSNTSFVPQPRSFRRFIKQMFAGFLKRQNDGFQSGFESEVIQQLKNLENKMEAVTRAMERQARRKQELFEQFSGRLPDGKKTTSQSRKHA